MSDPREKLAEIQNEEGEQHEEISPEQQEAIDQATKTGWRPDGKNALGETVSAERWNVEKPLYDTIGKLKSSLGKVDNQLLGMAEEQKKMAQHFIKEKDVLLNQLKAQRDTAIDAMEGDEVKRLNTQIDEVQKTSMPQPAQPAQPAQANPDWDAATRKFHKENRWYGTDVGMAEAARVIGNQVQRENPNGMPPEEYYSTIRERMVEDFGEEALSGAKQNSSRTSKVSTTNNRGNSTKSKTKVRFNEIDFDEQRVVQTMADSLNITVEEYMSKSPAYNK